MKKLLTLVVILVGANQMLAQWNQPGGNQFNNQRVDFAGAEAEPNLSSVVISAGSALTQPIISAGIIYVGATDGTVKALSVVDLSTEWSVNLPHECLGLAITNGVLVVSTTGSVHGLNPFSGQEGWSYNQDGIITDPVVAGERAYVTSAGQLIAFDIRAGFLFASDVEGGLAGARPAVNSLGEIIVGGRNVTGNARVSKFDATGTLLSDNLIAVIIHDGIISAMTLLSNDNITFVSEGSAGSPSKRATLRSSDLAVIAERFFGSTAVKASSPALASDEQNAFVGSTTRLVSYGLGLNRASVIKPGLVITHSSPAIDSSGDIYIADDDGVVFRITQGGATIWQALIGGILGSPSLVPGGLFISDDNGSLHFLGEEIGVPDPTDDIVAGWQDTEASAVTASLDTVYVTVSEIADANVISYSLQVNYDDAVVQAVGATSVGTLSESFGEPIFGLESGQITLGSFGSEPLTGAGTLVGIIFEVVGPAGAQSDICLTEVQLNGGNIPVVVQASCLPFNVASELSISGLVSLGVNSEPLSEVTITLTGAATETRLTGADGLYAFTELAQGDYQVTPNRTAVTPFEITCFGAAQVAQHFVGNELLTIAQLEAADVDSSGEVNFFDAALICRYDIGLPPFDETDLTGLWFFQPDERSYSDLQADALDQDFVGVLRGHLGEPVQMLNKRTLASLEPGLEFLDPEWSEDGSNVTLRLAYTSPPDAIAFSLDLSFSQTELQLASATPLESWHLERNVEAGRVRLGMFAKSAPLDSQAVILTMKWQVTSDKSILAINKAQVNSSKLNLESLALVRPIVSSVSQLGQLPSEFHLAQNYPNPFNPSTNIQYALPEASHVRLQVFNMRGQVVTTLIEQEQLAGQHEIVWDGKDAAGSPVASGVYLLRLTTNKNSATRRMALQK